MAEKYILKIIVPGAPENLNAVIRMKRQQYNRVKKNWHQVIWALTVSHRPPTPLKKFKIRIIRYSARMLDFDGLVGSMKPLVDGLRHSRIIRDDSWPMTGPWDVSQEFRPEKEGKQVYLEVREE